MARTDEDEFWDMFDQLSPQEQDNLLYDQQYSEATEMPWTFGGGMEPELDYGNYDLFEMGNVDIPEMTAKGKVDPFDLSQQAKRVNLAQDYGALTLDNILSGMAGPGAYDIDAFTPTYEYGEPLNMKGRRTAESLAARGGYDGYLANAIFNEGKNPSEAEAEIWAIVDTPDDDPDRTPEEDALRDSIIKTMPATLEEDPLVAAGLRGSTGKQPTGRARFDQKMVRDTAQNLYTQLMEDPEYAYYDEATGRYYDRTPEEAMVKTPQMEFFEKYGLPYPTANYDDPERVSAFAAAETGVSPEDRELEALAYDEEQARMKEQVSGLSARTSGARKALGGLQRAFDEAPMVREVSVRHGFGEDQDVVTHKGGMFRQAPRVGTTFEGDIVPYDFGKASNNEDLVTGRGTFDVFAKEGPFSRKKKGKLDEPVTRRGTKQDLRRQGSAFQKAASKTQQASRARNQAQYNDPRLAEIEAMGRMIALRQSGRTPFNDAVALRRQGTRAMGI